MLTQVHYGDDFYLDRVRYDVGRSVVFYGKEGSESLLTFLDEPSLEPYPVVWDDAQEFKPTSNWIKSFPTDVDPFQVYILYRGEKLPSAWTDKDRFVVTEHKSPKPYSKDFENFFQKEAHKFGYVVPDRYLPTIVDFVGEDLYRLSLEARKIGYVTPKGSEVSQETLKRVLSSGTMKSPFPVLDAYLRKDIKKTLTWLGRYLEQEGDAGRIPLVASFLKQTEKMIMALSLVGQGEDADRIGDKLGMHPWRYRTHWHPHVVKFKLDNVKNFYIDLLDVDASIKGGTFSVVALEVAILRSFGFS